ncbi:MAG: hypothetical protein CFE33_15000 [Pseudorhodobacter sp. PARRP1]|nr:MAG: hypothetical protein CFE33_15000 [Pseudorhodobacter sp. PARRP1]
MQIILSPQRRDARLNLARHGDILTINGENFDFSPVREGAVLPAAAVQSDWFAGDITRQGGALIIRLFLPHGPVAPRAALFPEPLNITSNGPIPLPDYALSPEEKPEAVA